VYLFFAAKAGRHAVADWLFAVCHLVMLCGLAYTIVATLRVLSTQNFAVNDQFIGYMIPALILVGAVCAVPIWGSYRRKA